MSYEEYLRSKAITDPPTGIANPPPLPDAMFEFQRDITSWNLRRGRAALMASTGLGKSLQELAWSQVVAEHTGKPVILFAPLAVSAQMVREAVKFGIDARQVATAADVGPGINVTNYQKLQHFDMSVFGGVVLDEASILKSETGYYRNELIAACKDIPFRLVATATPAPNDYMELGNYAEFLGIMSFTDMLATFFVHDGGETQKWRLKGHAESEFWRWMASWAIMIRKPSDLGYSDEGYDLPPLTYHHHNVSVPFTPNIDTGLLFPINANTLQERQAAKRGSITERVAKAVEITPGDRSFCWWTHLNAEAEALTKALPGAVNLHGGLSEAEKERIILAFCAGDIRLLVTKASLMGYGINAQVCADTGFLGMNDSWEQFYQAVRRFWRFGQQRPVTSHVITTESLAGVTKNLRRKAEATDAMFETMIRQMSDAMSLKRFRDHHSNQEMPAWL